MPSPLFPLVAFLFFCFFSFVPLLSDSALPSTLPTLTVPSNHKLLYSVVDTSPDALNGWQIREAAPPTTPITLYLTLTIHNQDMIESLFNNVSDPHHPQWLEHKTREELHEITKLSEEEEKTIYIWLENVGISRKDVVYAPSTDCMIVETRVGNVNSLFHTTLFAFNHPRHPPIHRQVQHSFIPLHISPLIEAVPYLSLFPNPIRKHMKVFDDKGKDWSLPLSPPSSPRSIDIPLTNQYYVPPASLYELYQLPDRSYYTSSFPSGPASTGTVQFFTYDGQGNAVYASFYPKDMTVMSELWSTNGNGTGLNNYNVQGDNGFAPAQEVTLDMQAILTINPAAPTTVYLPPSSNTQLSDYYQWITSFEAYPDSQLPKVISISYGYDEQTSTGWPAMLGRWNTESQKVGLRGISLIASSGDDGANGGNTNCEYNGRYTSGNNLNPSTPALLPAVTAVGGTSFFPSPMAKNPPGTDNSFFCQSGLTANQFTNSYNLDLPSPPWSSDDKIRCVASGSTERATDPTNVQTDLISSGGGFSQVFSRSFYAFWQNSVVNTYLNGQSSSSLPPSSYFNSLGRAIPDVSMYGAIFPTVITTAGVQGVSLVAGTSLSAPLFAALISLLNEYTMVAKGRTLGPLNNLLYTMASNFTESNPFNDINIGNNVCPSDSPNGCSGCVGYQTAPGWDPVTGLGSPVYESMLLWLQTNSIPGAGFNAAPSCQSLDFTGIITVFVLLVLSSFLLDF